MSHTLTWLLNRAQVLYPGNAALQREWLRAVAVVRDTSKGWCIERGRE